MVTLNACTTNPPLKTRYNSLDLVKFIMAIAVVAGHTRPFLEWTDKTPDRIMMTAFMMIVPFFFISFGFLMAQKMHYPFTDADAGILRSNLLRTLKLYLIWMLVYTPLAVYHFIQTKTGVLASIQQYLRGLLFLGEQYNSWQLWYLLSTIYSLLFLLLLFRCKISNEGLLLVSVIFAALLLLTNWLTKCTADLPYLLVLLKRVLIQTIGKGRIFEGMIYLPIGILLARYKLNPAFSGTMFTACVVLFCFTDNIVAIRVLSIVCSISFFELIVNLPLKDSKVYPFLRKSSTIIYFIHMYVWTAFYTLVYGHKKHGVIPFLATTAVSALIAFVYLFIKQKSAKNKAKKEAEKATASV